MKFLRTFSMLAEGHDGTIANGHAHMINFPLTCKFNIIADNTQTMNTATFQIFNLSRDTRNDLYHDPLISVADNKQILFSAGFIKEPYPSILMFKGSIDTAYSYRQGPDWITEIQAIDGGNVLGASDINLSFPGGQNGYTLRYALTNLINKFGPVVTMGLIGKSVDGFAAFNPRGISFSGNPYDLLVRQCTPRGLTAFIYKQKGYVLSQTEFRSIAGGIQDISIGTGMLGSPRLQAGQVVVDMIFEPRIEIAQNIQLITSQNRLSGNYIVGRAIHQGTISGAVCEDLKTQVTLFRSTANELTDALTGQPLTSEAIAGVAA